MHALPDAIHNPVEDVFRHSRRLVAGLIDTYMYVYTYNRMHALPDAIYNPVEDVFRHSRRLVAGLIGTPQEVPHTYARFGEIVVLCVGTCAFVYLCVCTKTHTCMHMHM
jgi:hypothetical protein